MLRLAARDLDVFCVTKRARFVYSPPTVYTSRQLKFRFRQQRRLWPPVSAVAQEVAGGASAWPIAASMPKSGDCCAPSADATATFVALSARIDEQSSSLPPTQSGGGSVAFSASIFSGVKKAAALLLETDDGEDDAN